jgi:hypothetical protein
MSIIVNLPLMDVYEMVCSKSFISKIFLLESKHSIKKMDNGRKIIFSRPYDHSDLHKLESVKVPDDVTRLIENNLRNVKVEMDTEHEVIKHNEHCFIIKYTSILSKPDYVHHILGNTKIILYAQFTENTKDKKLTVIHFTKKLVNANDIDDDNCIINADNTDIITNVYNQETLKINEGVISIAETLLGYNFVHDFVIPFINSIFNTAFSILQDIYVLRFIKYVSKRGIEVYKKKG